MSEHLDDPELEQFIHQKVMKSLSKIHRRIDMIENVLVMTHVIAWATASGARINPVAKIFANQIEGWKKIFPDSVEDLERMKGAALSFGSGPDDPADSGPGVGEVNTRLDMLEYVWIMSHVGGLSSALGQQQVLLAKTISSSIDGVKDVKGSNPTAATALENMRARLKQMFPKA